MAYAAYAKGRTASHSRRTAAAKVQVERRPPSGDLINAILQYADVQEPMGAGRVRLSLSSRRIADPVISGPLGREAHRLFEVSVIWDEREDEIFRIVDDVRAGQPAMALADEPWDESAAEEGAFELTPSALAYIARYGQ
ncbi:hypothetical protein [Phenylobacterium montanum]|uniref:Uncharacterized protein n=1 Tax=Phenylobacterium montanum TaxID=2823693 RepID=A0A975FXT1_9CAUL|nr:hypothetical protein [Caulobacter sp. S6]QUD86902.1 hypothetical protein KCG34_17750 [Caulobacter sp. S6]